LLRIIAVAGLVRVLAAVLPALVEAVAQPVLGFPAHQIRPDLLVALLGVLQAHQEALLLGPTVAGLAPFIEHGAPGGDDAATGFRRGQAQVVERAIGRKLLSMNGRCGE
jgi:hypothetical protein